MVFFSKYLKPLNVPVSAILVPFDHTVRFFTKPRTLFANNPKSNLNRDQIKSLCSSFVDESRSSIEDLAQLRLEDLEKKIIENLDLKPRIAIEYEFSLRDSKGKPVKLNKFEKIHLESILKRELPSFHELQKNLGIMCEFKFDTKGILSIGQLLADIKKFKANFSNYLKELDSINQSQRSKLRINDTPYQPDIGCHGILFTNTAKLHVNISFKDKNDKNIFAGNRELLEAAVRALLEQQLPTLALLIDKPGLDRIHKGSASTDMIAARENLATGGVSKFSKLAGSISIGLPAFAELIIADSGAALQSPIAFYSLALMTLSALMFQRPLSQGNSSLSIRSSSDSLLFSLVQKLTKRSAKGKESTRIENRIIAGNQDAALAILTTLYPIYNVLKNKLSSIETGLGKDRLIPENPVDLINHALSEETKLREIYGDQLFEKLLKRMIDHFC